MPINRAKEKLEEYRTTGHISRPVLGIYRLSSCRATWPKRSKCRRPAASSSKPSKTDRPPRSGLRGYTRVVIVGGRIRLGIGGNLIVAIDGNPASSQDALQRALSQKRPGEKMVLTIYRANRTMKVTVTLGSAPEAL